MDGKGASAHPVLTVTRTTELSPSSGAGWFDSSEHHQTEHQRFTAGPVGAEGLKVTHNERLEAARRDLGELNAQELEACHLLIQKCLGGARKYGHLDLASDGRDWEAEISAELQDAAFYSLFRLIQRRTRTAPDLAGLAAREGQ